MPLSHDVAEVVRQAAIEIMTRRLSAEEVWGEVLRLVREADTPEKVESIGTVIGKIKWLADSMRAVAAVPPSHDGPHPAAPAVSMPEPMDESEAA